MSTLSNEETSWFEDQVRHSKAGLSLGPSDCTILQGWYWQR